MIDCAPGISIFENEESAFEKCSNSIHSGGKKKYLFLFLKTCQFLFLPFFFPLEIGQFLFFFYLLLYSLFPWKLANRTGKTFKLTRKQSFNI